MKNGDLMGRELSLTQISSGLRREFHYHFWLRSLILKDTRKKQSVEEPWLPSQQFRPCFTCHLFHSALFVLCLTCPLVNYPSTLCTFLGYARFWPCLIVISVNSPFPGGLWASWGQSRLWSPVASGCLAHTRSSPVGVTGEGQPHTWHRQAGPRGKCPRYL